MCGYNIVVLAGFVSALSALFLRKRRTWLAVVLVISAYVVFVGASASVVRAGIMGLLVVLGPAFGRPSYALNSLAFAALLMALLWPFVLWDAGFQLTFAATLAILLLVQPLGEAYGQWLIRHLENAHLREVILLTSGDLVTSVAATLATLPLIAYYFHNFSLAGLPVNLLVLPAQPAVMATGLLVIVGGLIHPALGQVMGWLAWPFLTWTAGIVEWAATLPAAAFELAAPGWAVVVYYVVAGGGAAWWISRQKSVASSQMSAVSTQHSQRTSRHSTHYLPLGAVALAVILIWAAAGAQPDGLLHVSFLDVGQGHATLIRTPSGQMAVIDGGPGATALVDALGRSVPFYQHDVALGVLTRASDENLTGLVAMLERYHVSMLLAPADLPRTTAAARWRELSAQQAIPTTTAADAVRVDLGDGVQLVVVQAGDDEHSMALRLSYGHVSIHFEGGGETTTTTTMPATILRANGHGDANAASQALLDALTPSFAVFSLGAGRSPTLSAESEARIEEAGAVVYRTDRHGTITFTTDGERVWVETEH